MQDGIYRYLWALIVSLCWSVGCAYAQGLSSESLSKLSNPALTSTLRSYGPIIFDPTGSHLYVGSSREDEPRITQFSTNSTGALAYQRTSQLASDGSTLKSAGSFAMNEEGSRLYVAGTHKIATVARNLENGTLTQTAELEVSGDLSIQDIELSNDGKHLYVVSNNFSFDTNLGASALHTFSVAPNTGTLALVDSRAEASSPNPLQSLTLPSNSDLVFLNKHNGVEINRRNQTTGALTLLQSGTGMRADASTADGRWFFSMQWYTLGVYRYNEQTGDISQTQRFRSNIPPMTERALAGASVASLSLDEQSLIVTGYAQIGVVAGGIRANASSDVFLRDLNTGELRREGRAAQAGSAITRHPNKDWFYTFIPSFAQTGGLSPTWPELAQQALLPVLPETRIIAAVLPNSRVESNRGEGVTAFATVLNTGPTDALGCSVGVRTDSIDGLFLSSQVADPVTNLRVPNTYGAFDVIAGGAKQLLLEIGSYQGSEINEVPELLDIRFFCRNSNMTDRVVGVTTFAFASDNPALPDMLTITASPDRPGVVSLPHAEGQSYFTVATINLGGDAVVTAQPALELAGTVSGAEPHENLPAVEMLICETNPETSQCKAPFSDRVERSIGSNQIATYTVVVRGFGEEVPFKPALNRAFILMLDVDGQMRGGNSVAIETR